MSQFVSIVGLLFHSFMDSGLIFRVRLIELINTADTTVSELIYRLQIVVYDGGEVGGGCALFSANGGFGSTLGTVGHVTLNWQEQHATHLFSSFIFNYLDGWHSAKDFFGRFKGLISLVFSFVYG